MLTPREHRQRRFPRVPKLGARFFATTRLDLRPEEWRSPGIHFDYGYIGIPITKSSKLTQDRGWALGPTPESSDSAKLCAQCSDLDVDMLFLAWLPYNAWHQGPTWNLGEVQNRPWCQFCQILADLVDRQSWERNGLETSSCLFDPTRTTLRLNKSASFWDRESAEPGEYEFWPSGLRLRIEGEVGAGQNSTRMVAEGTLFIFPLGDPSLSSQDNIGCIRPVRELIDFAVPTMWIKTCIESHAECAGSPKLEPPDFNIRVVDADKMSIVSLPPGQQYVALSYVWGAGGQPRLQRALSEVWAEEGALRSVNIPPTIADAIEVTRLIGQRYLWVDALCIVQDDPHDVERQIKAMHSVYYHAHVTIAAASGDDVNAGLPGSSHLRPRVDLPRQIYSVRDKQFAISTAGNFSEVESSTWETRAWTFQEQLLSRRILYFTGTSMYFECVKTRWFEDAYGEPALQQYPASENGPIKSLEQYSTLSRSLSLPSELWCTFICTYLGRSLTNSNDILNGMTGVLAAMKDSWGEFHFGIPLNDFWAEIIWYWTFGHNPRRVGFPSWSWCGWDTSSIASRSQTFTHFRNDGTYDRGLLDIFITKNGRLMRAGMSSRPTPRTDHEHFYNDEEPTQQLFESFMQSSRADISQMLFFHTSWATLRLERPVTEEEADGKTGLSDGSSLAWILNPKSNSKIGSIFLPRDWQWDPEKLALHDFIVIVQCEPSPVGDGSRVPRQQDYTFIYEEDYPCIYQSDGESVFRLMLIRWEAGASYRVGISSAVFATAWWDCDPQKKLIALG